MKDFSKNAFSGLAVKTGVMSFVLLFLSFAFASQASAAIVINEIYGGGGNASATFNQDFVELYNNGMTSVDIAGYSLQYASATGAAATSFTSCAITAVDTVIEPGTYFLISASGTGATGTPITANANCNTLGLAAGAGKVALVSGGATRIDATTCPPTLPAGEAIVDFVGYGSTASCSETSPAPGPSTNAPSIQRNPIGSDTNNNSVDFALLNPPTPTAGGFNPTVSLTVTPTTASETGQTQLTATVTASAAVTGNQTVNFALTSGTAGTADFVSIPATITILSGQTVGMATFNVFDDALVEGAESATFTISSPSSGISLGIATSATVNITDNDTAALPDLTISQSAPSSVTTGSSYTYTLTVTNTGATNLTNVAVNFTVPSGVTYVAADSSPCSSATTPSSGGTGTVQFTGCTVNANSTAILTVTVLAPATLQTITSTGTNVVVDPPPSLIAESNETNNTAATITTTVGSTAAMVNVGGRVIGAKGRGISGALVTMTDGNGNSHSATTDDSGNYLFEGVEVGQTLIFDVRAKRYTFTEPTQVVSLAEETFTVNFTGVESRRIIF